MNKNFIEIFDQYNISSTSISSSGSGSGSSSSVSSDHRASFVTISQDLPVPPPRQMMSYFSGDGSVVYIVFDKNTNRGERSVV